jgi:hypothetical protein
VEIPLLKGQINSLTAMDVNLRLKNPSVDRQGRIDLRFTMNIHGFTYFNQNSADVSPCTLPIDGKTQ